ncbi:MAG: hypothetical protein IJT07_00725 [Oscillospiraceae bacterium]|nr:hypothetical protein [Oscillospiraceae bacterium]
MCAGGAEILQKYREGKRQLEQRICDNELWWELRQWDKVGSAVRGENGRIAPTSAWLFNAIANKHADAMDNFPEPLILPREKSDEQSAKALSQILPVVLEKNEFERVYAENWWEKLKHGTAAYGIFWDPSKENGLGDIAIRRIDLLQLYWEPGIEDLQDSRNLFVTSLVPDEILREQYPHLEFGGVKTIDVPQYLCDNADLSDRSVVVDWYYRKNGRLHLVKFVGETLLYASENDPKMRGGIYDHAQYPVVLDVLFPQKGSPVGFGYVAICKDPQIYIDKLGANVLQHATMAAKVRYFISEGANVNAQQFADWQQDVVPIAGDVSDLRIRPITVPQLDPACVTVMRDKIEEMKQTVGNRDFSAGSTSGGVTAASAIAALQEAGSKTSRDMIAGSYRAYARLCELAVELMRQFYDEARAFRVTAPNGWDYASFSGAEIRAQAVGRDALGEVLYRKPVFDVKMQAQKQSPYSRMEQNETVKELFRMGFFAPERAVEALCALDAMQFEGIDKIRETLRENAAVMADGERRRDRGAYNPSGSASRATSPHTGEAWAYSDGGEQMI